MKKSTTRRALFLSFVSVFLCFTMLIGTTYAWFTDTVTSGVNQIVAGNLDVELYNGRVADPATKVSESTMLFDGIELWEPGATVYENFTVANEGNLALKYQLSVKIANATGAKNLADVLKVGVVEGGINTTDRDAARAEVTTWMPFTSFVQEGKLNANDTAVYGVVVWWEPSANDNDYNMNNGKTDAEQLKLDIAVDLFATQLEAEHDSFGNDFDKDATVPEFSNPVVLPENSASAEEVILSSVVKDSNGTANPTSKVTVPAALVQSIVAANNGGADDVESVALSHSSPVVNEAKDTVKFDYFDLVDQNGDAIDLAGNTAAIEVVIDLHGAIADGKKVDILHDGVVVAEDVEVIGGKVTYTAMHFCELVITLAKQEIADTAALKAAINGAVGGETFVLKAGDYTLTSLRGKKNITIIGDVNGGTNFASINSFDFGENTVIKNVTFKTSGAHSVRYATTTGDVVFENCVFEGKQYAYHVDNANGGTNTFNNCTFSGRNALAGSGTYFFNDCTFKYTYSNYNTLNIYSEATFNNCKWDSKLELYIDNGAKAIIDGDEITKRVVFISDARALESFQQSVNWKNTTYAGVIVMLSADIDMNDAYYAKWTPIGQTGATQFQGTFDGHGYTIKNLNVDSSSQTGANYSSGLFGWLNHATVKNLTVENATIKGNHNVAVIAGYMETSGCTISNCHVINATVIANHANDDACGDKVGVIVGHAGNAGVKVENCSAKDSTVAAGRDAGQIAGAALTANVVNCTAENVTVSATEGCTGANLNNAVIGRVLG